MKFCLPFILGIIIGWTYVIPLWYLFGVSAFLAFVYGLRTFRHPHTTSVVNTLISLALLMVFGMFKITYDARYVSDDRISNFISSGRTISLKGTISDLPRITGQSIRFVIEAEELEFNETNQIVSGGVLVSLYYSKLNSALAESLTYGREVMVRGELVP